jgi:HlyD family secretion protein
MKNFRYLYLFATSLVLMACGNKTETISPEKTNISESVYASGFVKSENQYDVHTKINGVVAEIYVKEGTRVTKGTPILRIDNSNSKLNSENARLVASANDYASNQGKLKEARDAIDMARKKMLSDSIAWIRQQQLWTENIGAALELEQAELNYAQAKVNLKKAQTTFDDINRQLQLASDQSKNNLKMAEASEEDLIVRSEIDGIVYRINVSIGELATSTAALAVIGEENFLIELNIDEFDIVRIRTGQKVILRLDSYQNQIFEAEVRNIYPMMNERTRTFRVDASFATSPQILYPNLTLEGNIIIQEKENVLTIPTAYLVQDSFVLLQNGTKQQVRIGLQDYRLTEILWGIDQNTKIVFPEK